jgi:hypothetical protein
VRILIVSHLFDPVPSPRAFRWSAIARRWATQGHAVTVLTAPVPGAAASERVDGVEIRRVGGGLETLRARLTAKAGASIGSVAARPDPARRALRWLYDRTWRLVYWPDAAMLWRRAALRQAEAALTGPPVDALVSVALPFTGHRVGLALRQRVPRWLADFGDPFSLSHASPPNNALLYARLNRRAEAKVVRQADIVTVTTAKTKQFYDTTFHPPPHKVLVIPPLAPQLTWRAAAAPVPGARRRLVYLGHLYPVLREPGPLLDLLRRLTAVEPGLAAGITVELYGAAGAFAAELARFAAAWPGFRWHGAVDRTTALGALGEADALINIANTTDWNLPSKLAEYAATGKPILNLAAVPDDASAAFLASYPLATTLWPEAGRLPLDHFTEFLRGQLGRRLEPEAVAAFLAPYGVERVADAYLAALQGPEVPRSAAAGSRLMPVHPGA